MQVESVSAERCDRRSRREEAEGESNPYDTHPPLRERVAALKSLPQGSDGDTRPAVSLLGDPQRWERRLLASAINEDWARSLTPVAWDKVVETVYVPMWRQAVKENAKNLAGTLVSRPSFAGKLAAAMARGRLMDEDQGVLDQRPVSPSPRCRSRSTSRDGRRRRRPARPSSSVAATTRCSRPRS